MQGFPVSSSGSRTAIAAAVGAAPSSRAWSPCSRTVLAVLFLRPVLAAFPSAALGAVVVYAATRLVDVPEFRRLARFRRSELILALRHHRGGAGGGSAARACWSRSRSRWSTCCAGWPGRTTRSRGSSPDLAGMHDVDDYPEATMLPGL